MAEFRHYGDAEDAYDTGYITEDELRMAERHFYSHTPALEYSSPTNTALRMLQNYMEGKGHCLQMHQQKAKNQGITADKFGIAAAVFRGGNIS